MKQLCSILFLIVLTAATTVRVHAQDTMTCTKTSAQEIAALFDRWNASLATLDPDKVVALYAPEAVLYHRAWRTKQDHVSIGWSYGRGQGAYYAKYLSVRDPYMLRRMISDIIRHVLLFPRRVWREPHRACGDAVYVLALVSGAFEWLLTQPRTR